MSTISMIGYIVLILVIIIFILQIVMIWYFRRYYCQWYQTCQWNQNRYEPRECGCDPCTPCKPTCYNFSKTFCRPPCTPSTFSCPSPVSSESCNSSVIPCRKSIKRDC